MYSIVRCVVHNIQKNADPAPITVRYIKKRALLKQRARQRCKIIFLNKKSGAHSSKFICLRASHVKQINCNKSESNTSALNNLQKKIQFFRLSKFLSSCSYFVTNCIKWYTQKIIQTFYQSCCTPLADYCALREINLSHE